jgi:subtilisin family serine protease
MPQLIVNSASTKCPPSVKRAKASEPEPASTASNVRVPPGIILTGGLKLRNDGLTGTGVKVAVIDSGVDAEHIGFNGRVTKQMWFRSGTPLSQDDHGTHVAGTIHMMAPDAELYDYRVFGGDGFDVDEAISISIFEACFDGCDIINMSLGGRWPTAEIRTAVQYAHSKGVIVVCAAGNEGDDNPLTNERR